MRYNPKSLMLIFCLFQLPADCQQSEPTRIVYRSEAEQRRFVEEYLKRGLPLGRLEVIGIMTEAIGELDILTRVQPWVVPLLEKTVQELSTNSVANKIQIDRIMRCIARSGRQTGLDTIIRLFGNHPDGPHWVQEFIYNSLDHPNYVSLWYNALDSPNKMVKEEAEKACQS